MRHRQNTICSVANGRESLQAYTENIASRFITEVNRHGEF